MASRPPITSVTSSAVARLAGVSRTTVSFVLNNVRDKGISPETWQRVQLAAAELGYEPNAAARTLAGGGTGTIAVVIASASHLYVDSFLAQLVASINEDCHRRGLKLLIESIEPGQRESGDFLQVVRSRSIDGVIVAHMRTAEHVHLRTLRDGGTPFIVLGSGPPEIERYHTLGDDTWRSAMLAVEHLLRLGHREIAFVNYAQPEYMSANNRERGWRQALTDHDITVDPAWLTHGNISALSGYEKTRELLARGVKFSAIFAGNDTIAFGVLRALREAGLRVPQDIAVIGYDDIPLAAFAEPALTTMRSDAAGQGRLAMQRLLELMGNEKPSTEVMHEERPAQLIVRESCGAKPPSSVLSGVADVKRP